MNRFFLISLLMICNLFLVSCGQKNSQEQQNNQNQSQTEEQENVNMVITAEEAKEIMDSSGDYLILDVREQDEYDAGHIAGAILIPYTELSKRAETELPNKDQLILIYCRSGRRSAIAAKTLAELGYTDIRDFGGIIDWTYEIEK